MTAPRIACPACSAEVAAGSRFCPSCGQATSSPSEMPTAMPRNAPALAPATRLISSDSIPAGGFTPGTILLDRYRVIGLLGRGGMGEVYRADDLKLGQPVALKFLPHALADDPVRRERLLAEVRIARQVSHPNVCRVYDIGEIDTVAASQESVEAGLQTRLHFLSMEYIDGEDLASLLKRIGHLHSDKALDLARQLCAGLAAAHDKGVLHRDLKPANVMIDGRGRVRITDFGLALAVDEEAAAEEVSGTPAYMAPEQLAGKGSSVRSDIYALGLVLYELYTGKIAFQAGTLAELRAKKESATPTAPSEITREMDLVIERVIMRCLDKDPRARPASVAQVAAALPGGDPLAAAIAAGETPSPEMVAASGNKEGLRPLMALAIVAFVAVGSVVAILLNPRMLVFQQVALDKAPQVLEERAREVLKKAGYTARPADSAYAFEADMDFLRYLRDADRSSHRWDHRQVGAVVFWYRQSPRPLERSLFPMNSFIGTALRVSRTDPPLDYSGEALIQLDPEGRLRVFRVNPPQMESSPSPSAAADWSQLFSEAGLEMALWKPTEPLWTPPVYADARAAWQGSLPQMPATSVRIEAASYRGKPVAFEIIGPWTRPVRMSPYQFQRGEQIAIASGIAILLTMMGGGLVFARRNLRLGRGDRRGASRLAAFVFAAWFLGWVLTERHVPTVWELGLFIMAVCWALFLAVLVWVLYVALEPFVRRRWPRLLVSWTRLVAGDWRDPLVGRDVLVGCGAGLLLAWLDRLAVVSPAWFGYADPMTWPSPVVEIGGFLPALCFLLAANLVFSFGILFLLFLVRVLVRREWLAGAIWVVVLSFGALVSETPGITAPTVLLYNIVVLATARYGLIPLIVANFIDNIFYVYPITLGGSAWYAGVGYAFLSVVAALTLFGFRTSLGGQPLFGSARLED